MDHGQSDKYKHLLDAALEAGTLGYQTDYNKIGGLRDLAGQTNALENIRKSWNTNQDNGRLSHVHSYAIATDSIDAPRILGLGDDGKGDGVVSFESQKGAGFKNIDVMPITAPDDKRNSYDYSHVGIVDQDITASMVGILLGFQLN